MHRGYRHIVLALGLIALLCAPALGQEGQPQGIGEDEEAGEQAQEDHPGDTAVEDQIVSPVETPQAEFSASDAEGDDQAAEQQQTQQPVFDWRAFVSAKDTLAQWIMAAFGVVATGVSIWAIILLRRTLRESRRATKAALRAAEAANATVDVTREMGERELRAYVNFPLIKTITNTNQLREDRPRKVLGYQFQVTVENAGATPAIDCIVYGDQCFVDAKNFQMPAFHQAEDDGRRTAIGPHTSMIGPLRFISQEEAQRVLDGKARLFLWWRAEYSDVFEKSPRRFVEESWEVRIPTNPEVLEPGDPLPAFSFAAFGQQTLN